MPKIQEENDCPPAKALHILARSMGWKPKFLHEQAVIDQLRLLINDLTLNFSSKSAIINYLAIDRGLNYTLRHSDQKDGLILDIPGLTGELKRARFENRAQMKMQQGRHEYYFNPHTTKLVPLNQKQVDEFIDKNVYKTLNED